MPIHIALHFASQHALLYHSAKYLYWSMVHQKLVKQSLIPSSTTANPICTEGTDDDITVTTANTTNDRDDMKVNNEVLVT
eukprot:CAMPEP_0197031028 /NCGR_PEP_ID=MMETSP1384-20130603/10147_1 /TAXON_ID=29189 /ORGANISM="Ammonia sp." /LENGTH=79 /DNA_ID=CAMNT_0042460497 /DNA_START=65 /DNA_END=301 /DNA_ORIENTATION=-